MRYAVVRAGVVENVTLWNGETTWAPPEGTNAIADPDGHAIIRGTFDGKVFLPPTPPAPPATDPLIAEYQRAATVDEKLAILAKSAGLTT